MPLIWGIVILVVFVVFWLGLAALEGSRVGRKIDVIIFGRGCLWLLILAVIGGVTYIVWGYANCSFTDADCGGSSWKTPPWEDSWGRY
jgi:hypothetical protein